MGTTEFDWDAGNWPKCGQHGVSQLDVEAVFAGEPLVVPDLDHSAREKRFVAVGVGQLPRPVFVVFTRRGSPRGVDPSDQRTIYAPGGGPILCRSHGPT